ncbi:MAG: hypothetical protein RML46_12715 [Anaerolineae bacterium]|nr:hypothetical protein [Anaerolineae bacterium]
MRDPMMNEGARRRKRVWKGTFWADPLLPADRIAIQMMERFPHIEPLVELAREVLEGWGLRAQTYWNRMEAGRVKMPLWDRMARALESHEERARLLRLVLRVQEMERAWALAAMQNPNLPIAPIDWRRAAWWLAERRAGAAEVRRKLQRAIEAYGIVLGRRRQRMATATLIGALAMRERGFENEAALWEWVVEVVSRGPLPDEESHPVDQAFEVWRRAGWDVERG